MRVIAVDWSGRAVGAAAHRWVAEVVDGRMVALRGGWATDGAVAHLVAAAGRDQRCVVGIDFSFSLPAWFLDRLGVADGPALWDVVATRGEEWLQECDPPFWGRPGKPRPHQEQLRETERAMPAVGGTRPKSTFQVGGAGAVGTASLRGMPMLTRLRDAGFAVWPFDRPAWPVVVEVWPRVFTGPIAKRRPEARRQLALERGWPVDVAASEDGFDAAAAAFGMWEARDRLACLPEVHDPVARREGRIWWPGLPSGP